MSDSTDNKKDQPVIELDAETLIGTLDQIAGTIDTMAGLVNQLGGYLSTGTIVDDDKKTEAKADSTFVQGSKTIH